MVLFSENGSQGKQIMTTSNEDKRFLISGAGLIGLLTAQALKSRKVDFTIFDRDESEKARDGQGWAVTLHWALNSFKSLLPKELVDMIYKSQVIPDFHLKDTGTFKYINATTGETIVSIPPSSRMRVHREKVRKILMDGIDVQWNCKTASIDTNDYDYVKVTCSNGTTFEGNVLLGCDGSNSSTRKIICGDEGKPHQLPIRFCGAAIEMSEDEVEYISDRFDPLLFQGTIPQNETFFWYSILSTPTDSQSSPHVAQVNLSWKILETCEPFESPEDRANSMKKHSEGLNSELSWLITRATSKPELIQEIKLQDWPLANWNNRNGKILLLGDAAHAMTMYRGEAANHGITDVSDFISLLDDFIESSIGWQEVCYIYCEKIKARATKAVYLSRNACEDAHNMNKISPESNSPLLAIRKKT